MMGLSNRAMDEALLASSMCHVFSTIEMSRSASEELKADAKSKYEFWDKRFEYCMSGQFDIDRARLLVEKFAIILCIAAAAGVAFYFLGDLL